jgi:hypothetical protein
MQESLGKGLCGDYHVLERIVHFDGWSYQYMFPGETTTRLLEK